MAQAGGKGRVGASNKMEGGAGSNVIRLKKRDDTSTTIRKKGSKKVDERKPGKKAKR